MVVPLAGGPYVDVSRPGAADVDVVDMWDDFEFDWVQIKEVTEFLRLCRRWLVDWADKYEGTVTDTGGLPLARIRTFVPVAGRGVQDGGISRWGFRPGAFVRCRGDERRDGGAELRKCHRAGCERGPREQASGVARGLVSRSVRTLAGALVVRVDLDLLGPKPRVARRRSARPSASSRRGATSCTSPSPNGS